MVVFQQTPGPSANPTSVPPSGRDGFIAAIQGTNSGLEQLMRDGLHAYSSYLDHQIWKCVSKAGPEWSAVFGPRNQWAAKIFSVLTIVTKYLSTSDSQTSLSDIVRHLLVETQSWGVKNRLQVRQAHDSDSDDMTLLLEHHLVFACLGWLSMLYTPFHDFSGSSDFRILRTDSMSSHLTNNAAVLNASDMHRPMGTMLRKMGLLPIMCPAMPPFRAPGGDSATFMKLSTVCYSSLRQIGDVSILWVNNLSEHCQFDAKRQELKIFRFPAYCLYLKRMESDVKVFQGILTAHTCLQQSRSCERDLPNVIQSYLREILISYRVLFGQEQKSRRLFRSRESIRARFGSVDDPVLQALCGRKQPSLLMDYLTIDTEKMVFDVYADFPFLGEKLLKVYNYNASQTPSPWRSLFLLDPRDSGESVNFFLTIVVVGGISITLSLIQTVIAIIALILNKN